MVRRESAYRRLIRPLRGAERRLGRFQRGEAVELIVEAANIVSTLA